MPDGKTILITGAGGGLGQALCRQLVSQGAQVIALDVDADSLQALAKAVPDNLVTFRCDITDEADCQRVVAQAGPVDILVNNAGITHFSRFRDMQAQTIARVMAVNFQGAVNMTAAVLPSVLVRRGSIVGISSVAGFSPLYGRSGYSASKHALQGFLDSVRSEVSESGVHVMLVCPSFIASQHQPSSREGDIARPGLATQTAGKPLDPDDVARQIIAGLKARKRLVLIGRIAVLAWWINRLFPSLYDRIMTRKTRPEFPAR